MKTEPEQLSLGPVIVDIVGQSLTEEDRNILLDPLVGGVILFTRNYKSPEQLTQLCQTIHQLRSPSLLIAADQEGGRVQRFFKEFSTLPSLGNIGKTYEGDKEAGKQEAYEQAKLMAEGVLSVGVDISLAPVLDLDKKDSEGNSLSKVVGNRSFGATSEQVIDLAISYINGLDEVGMKATGKHFPGHGSIVEDSHTESVLVDKREFDDIFENDLRPFKILAPRLAGIMPAHIVYPEVDDKPAGYSSIWLKDILRKKLGFKGLIFSDDLSMGGAHLGSTYSDRAIAALNAGCDMILVCNQRSSAIEVLNVLKSINYRVPDELASRIESLRPVYIKKELEESLKKEVNEESKEELEKAQSFLI